MHTHSRTHAHARTYVLIEANDMFIVLLQTKRDHQVCAFVLPWVGGCYVSLFTVFTLLNTTVFITLVQKINAATIQNQPLLDAQR